MNRTLIGIVATLALSSELAHASCVHREPGGVATVTVTSCTSTKDVATGKLANVDLPWVAAHVDRSLSHHKGIVVAGRVTRKVHLEQYGNESFRITGLVDVDEEDTWFVRGENLSCDEFRESTVTRLYVSEKCCDVFPPMDVPCLLNLGQAEPVSESLQRALTAAGVQ